MRTTVVLVLTVALVLTVPVGIAPRGGPSPGPVAPAPVGTAPRPSETGPTPPIRAASPASNGKCPFDWNWNDRNPYCTLTCSYCEVPDPSLIYLPRETLGSPAHPVAPDAGYPSAPAPMGLADLGVGASGPYSYNTSGFVGTIAIGNLTGFSPGYAAWNETPNWVSVQLDAVVGRVAYPGNADGTFWVENVARYNGTTLQFVDNIWNWTSYNVSLQPGTIVRGNGTLATSPNGTVFYVDAGPTYAVRAPFTLSLSSNVTVLNHQPELLLNYSISNASGTVSGTYDQVVFDGNAQPWWQLNGTPRFLVDGSGQNPAGYADDAELVLGGDGDGANANLVQANATLSLLAWDTGAGGYRSVPAAYDHGEDSAETSEGVAATYQGTAERLRTGPSLLEGLWNSTSNAAGSAVAPGWIDVNLTLPTPDAFAFGMDDDGAGFDTASWFATSSTGVAAAELPPPPDGGYDFGVWANGFLANDSIVVAGNATGSPDVTLVSAGAEWDAPVYLTSDAVAAALGRSGLSGVGYSSIGPTLWINSSRDTLAPPFLQLNDAQMPTFVLLAVDGLAETSVRVDAFGEGTANLEYRYDGGEVAWYPGWTQSYQFVGGSGVYSVDGVALAGNDTSVPLGNTTVYIGPTDYAPTIDLYATVDSSVSGVTASTGLGWNNGPWPGPGAVFDQVRDGSASNVTAFDGATAVTTVGGSDLSLVSIETGNASGTPANASWDGGGGFEGNVAYGSGAVALLDVATQNVTARTIEPGLGGIGVAAYHADGISVQTLRNVAGGAPPTPDSNSGFPCGYDLGGFFPCATSVEIFASRAIAMTDWTEDGVSAAAGQFVNDTEVSISNATFLDGYFEGLNLSGGSDFSLTGFVTAGAEDDALQQVTGLEHGRVADGTIDDGAQGALSFSDNIGVSFDDLRVENGSYGIEVSGANQGTTLADLTIENGATGLAGEFDLGTSFGPALVTNDSMGILYDSTEEFRADGVTVSDGSMGIDLGGESGDQIVHIWNVSATNLSVGVDLSNFDFVLVSGVRVANDSVGVFGQGLAWGEIANVTATAPPHALPGFINPYFDLPFEDAAVQLQYDQNLTVANVTASGMPWTITDFSSSYLAIDDVRAGGGGTTVTLNSTLFSTVADVFSYGAAIGLQLDFTVNVTIVASTIEASAGYGVLVDGGLYIKVYGNNFVGNNGASDNGTYDPATIQAVVAGTTYANFTWDGIGNFWSDWSSAAPYPLGNTVEDVAPQPKFLSTWLFVEADGLPVGSRWSVTLGTTAYPADQPLVALPGWMLASGPLAYAVTPPSGWVVSPSSGTVDVAGANLTLALSFSEPRYSVAFEATGLPNGTTWSVSVGSELRTNTTVGPAGAVTFLLPDGTYVYTLTALAGYTESSIPYLGEFVVAGANVTETIAFAPVLYSVTFEESGLPSGTTWTVVLGATRRSTSTAQLTLNETNGTYPYTVEGVPGWHLAAPARTGTLVVNGTPLREELTWSQVRYSVTFGELGLPAGGGWSVTLAGTPEGSSSASISFLMPNGTYDFTVSAGAIAGYAPVPAAGTVTVANGSASVAIEFERTAPSSGSTGLGPSELVAILLVAGGAVAVVLVLRRRRPGAPEEAREEPPLPLAGDDGP